MCPKITMQLNKDIRSPPAVNLYYYAPQPYHGSKQQNICSTSYKRWSCHRSQLWDGGLEPWRRPDGVPTSTQRLVKSIRLHTLFSEQTPTHTHLDQWNPSRPHGRNCSQTPRLWQQIHTNPSVFLLNGQRPVRSLLAELLFVPSIDLFLSYAAMWSCPGF